MAHTVRRTNAAVSGAPGAQVSSDSSSRRLSSADRSVRVEEKVDDAVLDLTTFVHPDREAASGDAVTQKAAKAFESKQGSEMDVIFSDSGANKKRRGEGAEVTASKKSKGVDKAESKPPANDCRATDKAGTEDNELEWDPEFASLVDLSAVPNSDPLPPLTDEERRRLENWLQFGVKHLHDDGWRADWSGNLQLLDKEIVANLDVVAQQPNVKPILKCFHEWVSENMKSPQALESVRLLFSHVYNMKDTPEMAKKILAFSVSRPAKNSEERLEFLFEAVRRALYDPIVLKQDGWTTRKAKNPEGASGGAYLIGRKIIWEKYDAIIIAFVHDDDIGDLWKAMWLEDSETFDLEADEMWSAIKKWEAREGRKKPKPGGTSNSPSNGSEPRGSTRYQAYSEYTVPGIEHGIVLATPFHQNARVGVLWPARVIHVSEVNKNGAPRESGTRRGAAKRIVAVMFLAPYWNGQLSAKSRMAGGGNVSAATSIYSTGALFEMENIEPAESTIQRYPYEDLNALSIDKVRAEFKFLGLPKAAFPRYLDSHRLAVALKAYAKFHIADGNGTGIDAFAALTDCHQMSIKTARFPSALLHIPYDYMLSQLAHPSEQASNWFSDDSEEVTEPVLQLHEILQSMSPPNCFGKQMSNNNRDAGGSVGAHRNCLATPIGSPHPSSLNNSATSDVQAQSVEHFASDYLLRALEKGNENTVPLTCFKLLGNQLSLLVSSVNLTSSDVNANALLRRDAKKARVNVIANECLAAKSFGEEIFSSMTPLEGFGAKELIDEWRKTCERIYRRAISLFSSPGYGNGVTVVITDSRCNQHLTTSGCFERAIRLPAAIRGAKKAGAGTDVNVALIYHVNDSYLDIAEKKILPKAHKDSYLKRLKSKISSLPPDARGVPLTDDSDGEGGADTHGSRGSYIAAVAGVAAALQGVDMVVGGECVSAFCATRPPGHHAGRELRAMNAVSNGFCLLNTAACAALYAVTPQVEGGRGLKRVCVIDFDVHHGNGTQDILCSTYDSRFLYVSLHAGGAHINGFESGGSDSEDQEFRRILGGGKQDGIYPGRCGDASPHPGVLNIPLGQKVTAHAIGTALITEVAPAVESFSPELIILSAGFDAHKHDPMGLGCLSAEDFGSVTDVACHMASKACSGRVVSVLEGGYGVPCCQPGEGIFVPNKYLELEEDMPEGMQDEVAIPLKQKLDKCYAEGFLDCVKEHVTALSKSSKRRK